MRTDETLLHRWKQMMSRRDGLASLDVRPSIRRVVLLVVIAFVAWAIRDIAQWREKQKSKKG